MLQFAYIPRQTFLFKVYWVDQWAVFISIGLVGAYFAVEIIEPKVDLNLEVYETESCLQSFQEFTELNLIDCWMEC